MSHIVLASTSPYRKILLDRLGLPVSQQAPEITENVIDGEAPAARAMRLAEAKARAVAARPAMNDSLIIGSDQVAHLETGIFDKPGTLERARLQLVACSGHWVTFTTAVTLMRPGSRPDTQYEQFMVKFRTLDDRQIADYLGRDQPLDCAASLKAESLGIALIEDTRGRDINTLYGLPLMRLTDMLRTAGIDVICDFKN